MTYTVAAARDMQARYAAFFGGEEAQRLEFRTINGVCSRIIRYYERTFGRTAFRLLEDGAQKSALIGELYGCRAKNCHGKHDKSPSDCAHLCQKPDAQG